MASVLVLLLSSLPAPTCGAQDSARTPPSAADLVRAVYAAEDWIRHVDSCFLRVEGVQRAPQGRAPTPPPSAADFERFLREESWPEEQRWSGALAWDRTRVRAAYDYPGSGLYRATAWNGQTMTVHERSAQSRSESYGLYDDSRKYVLTSYRVNLWEYGGLVTNDCNMWWRSSDTEEYRRARFVAPEDFRLVGDARVGDRECHVVESRAGRLRLYLDTDEHRVRRMTHFGVPNDLPDEVYLAAMRKAADVKLDAPHEWKAWLGTLDPERRLAAERELAEELFRATRIRAEVYPGDYAEVVPGGWMPRRYTRISTYPDWDTVEKTGKYTYVVSRADIEVSELSVNEPIAGDLLAIEIPEGEKVYDWRFDPPAEYEYRADRTDEELRAIAEEAKRKRDAETAPYREMVSRIEMRVGEEAPELPRRSWFNGDPLALRDLRGRVVLLHFWATWCAPCHKDIKTLVVLNKSPNSDPLVIGVHDAKADAGEVRKDIAERGMKYPICIDASTELDDGEEGDSLRSWYGIRGIPYTILIDTQGRVAGHGTLDEVLERANTLR